MAIKTIYSQNDAMWVDYDTGTANSIDYKKDQILGWGTMRYEDGGGSSAWDHSRPVFQFDVNAVPTADRINSVVLGIYVKSASFGNNDTRYYIDRTRTWLPDENSPRTEMNMSVVTDQRIGAFTNPASFEGWYRFNVTAAVKAGKNEGIVSFLLNFDDVQFLDEWLNVWSRQSASVPYLEIDWVDNNAPYAPANMGFAWNTTDWRWFNYNPQVTWNFSDPDAGNTQGQYQVQRTTDARGWGNPDYDTGGVATGNTYHDITWSNQGTNYVRVRTMDQYGAWGDWSYKTYQFDNVVPGASSVQLTTSQAIQPNNSFRVHAFGIGDDRSGIAKVEFPTAGPGYDFQWRDGVNDGNGTWHCDIPISFYNNNEGTYTTHVYVTDVAGNRKFVGQTLTNVDRTRATDPNVVAASVRSTSATLTWNGFSDPGASSGYLRTQLYVRKNGTANSVDIDGNGSIEDFITFTDNRTSYTVNGLLENTSYAFVVTHYDQAGNESNYTWKWLNSNSRPTANLLNLASAGYVLNQRPKIRMSGSDPEGTPVNFNLQISNRSDFTTTLLDVSAVGGTGWSSAGAVGGGVVNTYTPQVDLGIGTRYVRVRAGDGQEWGNWSATISMIIQSPNWPTAVKVTDRSVSKRTLDDLRNKVNAIRQQRAMGAIVWIDPAIRDWNDPAGATRIRAVHITELREAMQDVATLFGVTLTWSKADLNGAERNGQEWLDLRNAAMAI